MSARFRDLSTRFPGLASIGRNAVDYVGGEWAEALLRAVYAILIARWLGPEDYGWWSYTLAVSGVCITFTAMGTDLLLAERVGRDRGGALPLLDTSLAVRLILLCFFGGLMAAYALFRTEVEIERLALLVLLPTVLARGTSNWLRYMAVGFEHARGAMRPMVAVRGAEVLLGLSLLLAGANVIVLLALHSISWIVEVGVILPRMRRLAPVFPRIHKQELGDLLRRGSVIGIASAMTALLFAAPLILLRHHADDMEMVGQFGLALQLSMFAVMALQGVLNAAQSVLSRAVANKDARTRSFGGLFMGGCLVLAVPIWFGSLWLGVPVVTFFLGTQYEAAGLMLPACLMLAITVVMANGYWHLLVLHHSVNVGAIANVLAVILLVALAGKLVGQSGPVGAAYAGIAAGLLRTLVLSVAGLILNRQNLT